jgi:Uncharacterized conserved protein
MLQKSTFEFLKALKKNNHRDWFEKNKLIYIAAKNDVIALVEAILAEWSTIKPTFSDTKATDCLFRINRDVRFSKDKSPYKTNIGFVIREGAKKVPKQYLHPYRAKRLFFSRRHLDARCCST